MNIKFASPYTSITGYGLVSNYLSDHFIEDSDVNIEIINVDVMWKGDNQALQNVENLNKVNTDYIFVSKVIPNMFYFRKGAKANIILSTWEGTDLPLLWVDPIKNVDAVLTYGDFDKELFLPYNKNVYTYGLGIDKIFDYLPNIKKFDKFTYLYVGDAGERKGASLLLKAFSILEKKYKDIQLYIKTYGVVSDWWKDTLKQNGNPQNIIFDTEDYTNKQIVELYNKCHCLPYPTRAEGWGRTLMEAMACKLPSIATDYSGVKEFADKDTCYMIPVDKLVDIPGKSVFRMPFFKGQQWAQPNFEYLLNKMEEIYLKGYNKNILEAGYKKVHSLTTERSYNNVKNILKKFT